VLRSPEKTQALLDAVDAADLVTLAFPLYVDSLPAPVTEALERIAAHRQGRDRSRPQAFTAIANCGFPEAYQTETALAICETFARQAGFEWAGALALGAGGMLSGVPLAEEGGKTMLMRKSLELAAEALAKGQAIPKDAQELMAKPLIPAWAYRLMGGLGWMGAAKGYGALRRLWRRPYLARSGRGASG
jgi:multimeric flavodoxin WrbA